MPLSEDEQRILRDIERNFYENDPDFAASVSKARGLGGSKRKAVLAGVGVVLSLALVVASFTVWLPLAFAGFLGMVGCGFVAFQNVRRLTASTLLNGGEAADESGAGIQGSPRYRKRKK